MGHLGRRRVEAGEQAIHALARLPSHAGQLLVGGQAAHDLQQRPALADRVAVQSEQLRLGDAVDFGRGQVEEGDRVVGVGQRAQEADEHPHLFARVEAAAAREAVRDAAHVERAQERVGVVVAADEQGDVPRPEALAQALRDEAGDAVGLGGDRVEMDVAHRETGVAQRAQPLVDPGHRLQPVGVVVGDELAGGVQDHLRRAVVGGEDDLARILI